MSEIPIDIQALHRAWPPNSCQCICTKNNAKFCISDLPHHFTTSKYWNKSTNSNISFHYNLVSKVKQSTRLCNITWFILIFQTVLGRLMAMLFQWYDATAYLPDGKLKHSTYIPPSQAFFILICDVFSAFSL